MKFIGFFFFVFFITCRHHQSDCGPHVGISEGKKYVAKGCFVDSLENGDWTFEDDSGNITESGQYKDGLRIGDWHYPGNGMDSVIGWTNYSFNYGKIRFNVPVLLSAVEGSVDYVKFSNEDSSKLFNLVLSKQKIDTIGKLNELHKVGEKEILSNGWEYEIKKDAISTKYGMVYLNEFDVKAEPVDFLILNIYRKISDEYVLVVTARYSPLIERSARIVFFSVVSNLFIGKERFLNLFESN